MKLTFVVQRYGTEINGGAELHCRWIAENMRKYSDLVPLGFLPEEDKFDALEGARLLVMPFFYECLSMVTLEAWAMRKPILAYARCEVLKGQCLRSNAGLFYDNCDEFRESLALLRRLEGT